MKDWTRRIQAGGELSADEVGQIAGDLLGGTFADADKADFLEALHARGETAAEVRAFASAFLAHAEPFAVPDGLGPVLDVCGTGGDKLGLFNVSTAVMFVAAGAGARLVKHGNRGITSKCGGADVLEALGIAVDASKDRLEAMLGEAGATFLFAPRFHPAFKAVAPARQLLAARGSASVFNMLGPLLNPARPALQLTGVFSEALVPLYAGVLPELGRTSAWIVHGRTKDGGVMDEISTLGPTRVAKWRDGKLENAVIDPADLGVPEPALADLAGGTAVENAALLQDILDGNRRGAARDLVMVNAAAALLVAGLASGWPEAMDRAAASIDSGSARAVLEKMRRIAPK